MSSQLRDCSQNLNGNVNGVTFIQNDLVFGNVNVLKTLAFINDLRIILN